MPAKKPTKKPAKPRRGRPPKAAANARTVDVFVRFSPAEHSELLRLAAAAGQSVSEFIRCATVGPDFS